IKEHFPDYEPLSFTVADSKPAVWWTVKYKNRWLSDGSVISGDPIITNILWNEIGRGADLVELKDWVYNNLDTIDELKTAVFESQAPRYTDFFSTEKFDLDTLRTGQMIFRSHCMRCHGDYLKAWEFEDALNARLSHESLSTIEVRYPKQTRVVDVGTDAHRYRGMKSLERRLNPLEFSREFGIVIKAQKGYVPPPLVGIWARWPYFHNNSIPNLCALLTAGSERPQTYYAGPAI